MAFSDNLRKARKRVHMSQATLSGATGVSVVAICKYESGQMLPTVITAVKLAEVLGTTCEALVNGTQKKKGEKNCDG